MAKNGAGYDPSIEDVPPFVQDESEIVSEGTCIICGNEIVNLEIYELTGMCEVCATGEANTL